MIFHPRTNPQLFQGIVSNGWPLSDWIALVASVCMCWRYSTESTPLPILSSKAVAKWPFWQISDSWLYVLECSDFHPTLLLKKVRQSKCVCVFCSFLLHFMKGGQICVQHCAMKFWSVATPSWVQFEWKLHNSFISWWGITLITQEKDHLSGRTFKLVHFICIC